jgi:hypothetical protein
MTRPLYLSFMRLSQPHTDPRLLKIHSELIRPPIGRQCAFPVSTGSVQRRVHKTGELLAASSRLQESSGSAQCAVLKVNASVRKLLSTIKAHLVSPARNREWTTHVAMPAAKEPLEDGLYSKFHNLLRWQFVLHSRAPSCMRTLAPGLRKIPLRSKKV